MIRCVSEGRGFFQCMDMGVGKCWDFGLVFWCSWMYCHSVALQENKNKWSFPIEMLSGFSGVRG